MLKVSDRSPNTSIKLCTSKSMRVFTCPNTCCCYASIVILNYVMAIIAIHTPIHLAIFSKHRKQFNWKCHMLALPKNVYNFTACQMRHSCSVLAEKETFFYSKYHLRVKGLFIWFVSKHVNKQLFKNRSYSHNNFIELKVTEKQLLALQWNFYYRTRDLHEYTKILRISISNIGVGAPRMFTWILKCQ